MAREPAEGWVGNGWSRSERALFRRLDSPEKVQRYLDEVPYSAEAVYRSPRSVIRDRKGHCFDGALFAAAALRQLGHPPVIVDILAENDDDHILAVFRRGGRLGAVAKSNFVGLRFREPVYRTVRELVLSYFEFYYNVDRQKTMRGYAAPLDLARLDRFDWMTADEHLVEVEKALNRRRVVTLVTPEMARGFAAVDPRSYHAGLIGADPSGLYRPAAQG
jgi:hypothetical protein